MRSFQKLQWLVMLALLIGLVGCNSGDGGLTTPANVSVGDASPANFWVGRGGDKLGIYVADNLGSFQVEVPKGSYMLEYTVKDGGSFYIVFTADESGAFLGVGLGDGELDDVFIYTGQLSDPDLVPEIDKEGVKIYIWPGSTITTQMWTEVFMIDPTIAVIVLVLDGAVEGGDSGATGMGETKCTKEVTAEVSNGELGFIYPNGTIERPCNSSLSLKIGVTNGDFIPVPETDATVEDVTLNGISVLDQVQVLGNGDGHLVIHNIDMEIEVYVEFVEPAP